MGTDEAKLFVAGLPDSVTEDLVKEMFASTGGQVLQVSLPRHRDTGRLRGIGFVTMGSPQEAESARTQLDGSLQMGKSILVRPYQAEPPKRGEGGPRGAGPGFAPGGAGPGAGGPGGYVPRERGGPPPADRQLYLGNLPYDCTQEEVEGLVNGVTENQVVRVHLPLDPDGRKRGFGFVTMASSEAANLAITALKDMDMRGRHLNVKIAQPKGERPPPREGGFDGGGGGGYAGGGGGGGGGYGGGGGFSGGGGPPPPARVDAPPKGAGRGGKPGGRSWDDGPRKKRGGGGGPPAADDRGGRGGGGRGNWGGGDDD